jgi:hypothetical protein
MPDKDVQLHDIRHRAASLLDYGLEILECLLELRYQISRANDLACRVAGVLTP